MFYLREIVLLCSLLPVIHGAKILGVFSYCAPSHFMVGFHLMKELADRGHEVTLINSFPQKVPIANLREVSVEEMKIPLAEYIANLTEFGQMGHWGQLEFMLGLGKTYTEVVLRKQSIHDLLNSDEKFDLVIMEHFWNEALTIFAHRFKCPLIYFAPGPTTIFNNHLFANPAFSSYVPNLLSVHSSQMNFMERLKNTYLDIITGIFIESRLIPEQNSLLKATVPRAPDLRSIIYNASLMLVMSHISMHDPVPLQPSIKNVGGHHVGPLKPLPRDIQEFMDNATEGVVVFSMGSNLKSSDLDADKKRAILGVFSRIKQKVLWKFETDLDGKPNNVMISKWIPQQEVLAHPNTVAFISHCGLLGSIEAVHFGVPILGLPMFWDQYKNIEEAVRRGMAIRLDLKDLTEETFEVALTELLNNPKYIKNAKLRSQIMRDQPMTPLDEAVFWVEYVIRYEGAPHLRSAALNLKWYQKYLVDIILFITLICSALFLSIFLVIKCIFFKRRQYVDESKKYK